MKGVVEPRNPHFLPVCFLYLDEGVSLNQQCGFSSLLLFFMKIIESENEQTDYDLKKLMRGLRHWNVLSLMVCYTQPSIRWSVLDTSTFLLFLIY